MEREEDRMGEVSKVIGFFIMATLVLAAPGVLFGISTGERTMGGPCEYRKYEGHAVVTSISPTPDSKGTSYEKYAVKFHFYPDEEIQEPFARTEGKEFLLMVKGSYPGSQFLKRHRIRAGKVLHGTLKVMIHGTCTPTIFDFPFTNE